jgi:hypothetical protein
MPQQVISGPVINAGESLSSIVNASQGSAGISRIIMPAGWTPAWLTFQISFDGAVFNDVYFPDGHLLIATVVPNACMITDADIWELGYFRFRSGAPGYEVLQEQVRNFTCVFS